MRISTKCSLAVHVLMLIALFSHKTKVTSERLAESAGCNPVMVRNILGSMKAAGIVEIQRGTGGATLKMAPSDITLWTVYNAVDTASLEELMGLHPNPSQVCPVGKRIYAILSQPYNEIAESVKETMSTCTLEQLLERYRHMVKEEAALTNQI